MLVTKLTVNILLFLYYLQVKQLRMVCGENLYQIKQLRWCHSPDVMSLLTGGESTPVSFKI